MFIGRKGFQKRNNLDFVCNFHSINVNFLHRRSYLSVIGVCGIEKNRIFDLNFR